MFSMKNKIAVVTGAGSGIGEAVCKMMASLGAKVAVTNRSIESAERVVREINDSGGEAIALTADVSSKESVEKMIAEVVNKWGDIDILVGNAGGTSGARSANFIEEVFDEDFDMIVKRNLYGAFYLCRAVAPAMRKRRKGRIIIISSTAGRMFSRTEYGRLQYASSKAAQLGFVRQLAHEMGPYNVTVNSVAPGVISTSERLEKAWNEHTEEEKQEFLKTVPMGRRGESDEVAAAIVFLASDEASYITGHCIDVNGGRFMF